ncbi:MAG: hypothetical protein SFY67_06940 [Candidatus Melainabacteria bacterium]|nr:hypothetical protein [Candidatus Melainabacteria bacterium]
MASILLIAFAMAMPPCNAESVKQEIIPNELSVQIYSHKLPGESAQEAWTFVSEGLSSAGQSEMMMTIVKKDGEKEADAAHDPIMFFKTIHGLAKQNKLVEAGDRTELSPSEKGFIAPQFTGTIYLAPQPLSGVEIPDDAIVAMPVTREELAAYEIGGASRVSARLSRQDKFYPYPTWCDRTRKSVFTQDEIKTMKAEPINEAPTAALYKAGIIAEDNRLSLVVPPDASESFVKILKDLPKDAPLKLNLGVDSRANAFLVWSPGQAVAVAPPKSNGSVLSGSYIELLPGVKETELGSFGDGYVAMLTNDDWEKLKSAVADKKDLKINATASGEFKELEITFPIEAYRNPTDGQFIRPVQGWKLYTPDGKERPVSPADAKGDRIVFLTDQNLIASYIEVKELSDFILEIDKTVKAHFEKSPPSGEYEIVVQCDLSPEHKAEFQIAAKPSQLAANTMQDLYLLLKTLKVPASKGSFSFQSIRELKTK